MAPLSDDRDLDEDARAVDLGIAPAQAGQRLDRALAEAAAEAGLSLSRSRIGRLIAEGAVQSIGGSAGTGRNPTVRDPARKAHAGEAYRLTLPPPADLVPRPEPIPLAIAFEDDHLVVVDKPAGMVVHPAPGAESRTLVNALLAHCAGGLPDAGDARRPGIVHRIDKDTSGLVVVAKTQAAQAGLAAQFAAHTVTRRYLAVLRGAPDRADPRLTGINGVSFEGALIRVETGIARHRTDRKRMGVDPAGRRAVTRIGVLERFGPAARPVASLAECRLETGRTHQIRVHARHIGHALIGDPVYGRTRPPAGSAVPEDVRAALTGFPRQALHAATLGFIHPVTGADLNFSATMPAEMANLLLALRRIPCEER